MKVIWLLTQLKLSLTIFAEVSIITVVSGQGDIP